ncbi:hypothetical protein BHU72_00195 [Desulfuribacillus stibiiarsenatis]|uniref:Polysaccharide biosynthesis protein CapD-like domain-containing protein n=1 Tax=Desulfuribacillus stibiiarsenatis TaxID=1390249 RepID=A0A1E5L9U5_9FIRM|nr:UDP-N-acetylglucosamine 4,6-dehydratase family protein [Desulfuribacillus stibiiarsenatis]OEH86733.1 hypothetical protein BHU72_00195 [Desulfuribacillus stibiiarsenatis]
MFEGKKILITGGTGTIGQAMVDRLLLMKPEVIRIFSRDEYKQFQMKEKYREHENIRFLLGDIRDKERLGRAMNDIDVVFSLAALKHVPACEYDPYEAVKTNVIGTQNIIACALEHNVKKVIYASSDKAVSPTNTMGATKLLAERLVSSADYSKGKAKTIFSAVRFGNVIGSRGSVIPLWREQIIREKKITITEPDMTRFMMSISESVELLLEACEKSSGGEIFVLKMPIIRLIDLAYALIDVICEEVNISPSEITIQQIGLRTGEKMYEELMTEDESLYAVEYEKMFAVQRTYSNNHTNNKSPKSYSSYGQDVLSITEIYQLIKSALNSYCPMMEEVK